MTNLTALGDLVAVFITTFLLINLYLAWDKGRRQ